METNRFDEVVDAHYENLYRFGYSLTQNRDDAADLVQETFSIFAKKSHQIREPDKIKSWLFTTLRREFFAQHRRSERFIDDAGPEIEALAVNHADSLDGEAVMAALGKLPLEYREPLALYYLEELSYQEIAALLEIPVGTVMSRLSRAKAKLRSFFQNE